MADWTDESKAALQKAYLAQKPTAETSAEILESLTDEFDCTVNGARIILSRAGVYVKKAPAAKAGAKAGGAKATGEKKETKQESLDRLTAIIAAQGIDADDTVISKLTGKAAAYFADTIATALAEEDEGEAETETEAA